MAAEEAANPGSILEGFEPFATFATFANLLQNDLSSFPVDSLPSVLSTYSKQIEESLQVVNEMVSPVLLGVSAMCIQGGYYISPKQDWKEPLNLYILTINNPSEKKTPVLKEVLTPIYDYVDKVNKERQPLIVEYKIKKNILIRQIERALKAAGSKTKKVNKDTLAKVAKVAKPSKDVVEVISADQIIDMQNELAELEEEEVKQLTMLADDVTTEALVKLLNENNERIAIASAEGGIFGMLAGRYSSHPNIDIFLKGYSGEPYTSHRVSGRMEMLREPLITLVLMMQPVVLMEALVNKEFRERGLLSRFLYSMAGTKVGRRKYRTVAIDEKVRKEYHDLIFELLECREWEHGKIIYLSDDADKLGEEFFNEIETTLYSQYEEMGDWIGKLFGQTMRIAGVLHVIKYRLMAAEVKVEAETMQSAIDIGRYCLEHAKKVFLYSGMYDSPEVKNAKYILSRIDSVGKTQISKRDVYDLCKGKKGFETPGSEAFATGLEELRRRGYIKIDRIATGGRPMEMIVLNPLYLQQRGG